MERWEDIAFGDSVSFSPLGPADIGLGVISVGGDSGDRRAKALLGALPCVPVRLNVSAGVGGQGRRCATWEGTAEE